MPKSYPDLFDRDMLRESQQLGPEDEIIMSADLYDAPEENDEQ